MFAVLTILLLLLVWLTMSNNTFVAIMNFLIYAVIVLFSFVSINTTFSILFLIIIFNLLLIMLFFTFLSHNFYSVAAVF